MLGTPDILKRVMTVMVHTRKAITASTGWILLLLLCGGCITHPLGVRDPVAPTAFPQWDLVPLRNQGSIAHSPFYGYTATCWRPWPQNWHGCPPQDQGTVIGEGTLFGDGVEIVDEDPAAGGPVPPLAPTPMPDDTRMPSLAPAAPVPTDLKPEISDDGPLHSTPANPDSDGTLDPPPEKDAGQSIEIDPDETPVSASLPEPSQATDEPEAEPSAATAAQPMATAPAAKETPVYLATSNHGDIRFGNAVSLVAHDRPIGPADGTMPDRSASPQGLFHLRVRLVLPFLPERAHPNRLAVFDTEKASSDIESDESAATSRRSRSRKTSGE